MHLKVTCHKNPIKELLLNFTDEKSEAHGKYVNCARSLKSQVDES